MREIKFRVWYNGKLEHFDLHNITVPDRALMSGEHPVQQYTGLNDKNGVEIYEGDIVQYKVRSIKQEFTITAKVEWKDFGFTLLEDSGSFMPIVSGWTYEIVGNVFETNQLNNTSDINRSFYPTVYGMKYKLVPDNA